MPGAGKDSSHRSHNNSSDEQAVIYCRVSGPGQEQDGTSLESQEAECRQLAARLGYSVGAVVREVFRGTELFDRPQLTQLRADIRAGRYAALLVYDPDRLARDPVHQSILVEEALRHVERVEFVLEPLDTTPEGQLIRFVRGFSAAREREKIRERTMRGKRVRREAGKLGRGGADLYGYRRDHERGVRLIYEPEAAIVRRVFELRVHERLSFLALARLLDGEGVPAPGVDKRFYRDGHMPRWSTATIRLMLREPAYIGETYVQRLRGEVAPPSAKPRFTQYRSVPRPREEWFRLPDGVTPPIVSRVVWDAAQDVSAQRLSRRATRDQHAPRLLRGRLFCGTCRRPMWVQEREHVGRRPSYRCTSVYALDGWCHGAQVQALDIEAWAWGEIAALITDTHTLAREAEMAQETATDDPASPGAILADERRRLEATIARTERQQARMLTRYNTTDDERVLSWSLVESELARLEQEKVQARARLADVTRLASQTEAARDRWRELNAQLDALRADLVDERVAPAIVQQRILDALDVRVEGNGRQWILSGWLARSEGEHAEGVPFLRKHSDEPHAVHAKRRAKVAQSLLDK